MTIFGIAGSMALMLVGYGIQDSVSDIVNLQYANIQHYDGTIISDDDATEQEKKALTEELDKKNWSTTRRSSFPNSQHQMASQI